MPLKKGFVHIYTGNGKGKTSAALGLCLRAIGRGLKCCFLQFVKGKITGEMLVANRLSNFEFIQLGRPGFDFKIVDEDYIRAENGIKLAEEKIKESDVIVLDEINVAIHLGLIPMEKVVKLVKEKPESVELILTGRHAKKEIIELADYVTEIRLLKHPFYRGVHGREGIDY
ncbi:cob(I)yrinic acid a,c-diamide adenosyltransferase [Desulfurobacterium thermolithotrophum]|uniref:cob(I)yrinic acid a,c-diamide adenosyltransferase n=1 Tax=Desulfurobacterium thermolithotrophum TaxID=64160 RepID=UPI0013D093C8|nr:cob(I)yrinic acid a,c-diamide adenosyltransferase [Desulfurobacterium thermolithotrophum]